MRSLLLITAIFCISGCDTVSTTPVSSRGPKQKLSTDGVARYEFHRNAALSEVKKTLPVGSVDYIDFDMADDPCVLVVVTASAPPEDGLTFTTAFSGSDNRMIEKQWAPSTNEGDDEHVGIFVLPKSINVGRTFRSRSKERTSIDESAIIF